VCHACRWKSLTLCGNEGKWGRVGKDGKERGEGRESWRERGAERERERESRSEGGTGEGEIERGREEEGQGKRKHEGQREMETGERIGRGIFIEEGPFLHGCFCLYILIAVR
jgi:hypothetical protein